MTFEEIITDIVKHHRDNPDHGLDCACLDTYIGQIRKLSSVEGAKEQRRVDYVMRMAVDNRPPQPVSNTRMTGKLEKLSWEDAR